MREELHRLQTQLNLTTTEIAEKCTIFEELQAVNRNLQDRINDYEISSKIMENTIQTQKKHLDCREEVISEGIVKEEEYIYKLKEINMETEKLQQKLNKECDINEELKKSLKETKTEEQSKEKDLIVKEKEINKLKKELEKQDKEKQNLTGEIEIIQADLSQLRLNQDSLEQEIIQLTQENDRLQKQHDKTDKNWNNERETKTKKMTELESKQKELKSDIVSKNKQIKELEKELKTTKSKLATQTKSAEDSTNEIEKMSEELEMLKTMKIDLEEKLQAANNNEVKVSSKLRTEMADIKNQLHQAVKDKNDSIGRSDAQIADMMATLQKYKMENQKIVDQKEKELDSLRTKFDQSSNLKEKNNKLCDDLKKETDELKKKIDDLEKKKRNLSQTSNNDGKKIKELQSKLEKKEKEIKELTTKVSTPKEKAESQTICTQTSPPPIQKIFKEVTTPLRKTFIPSTPKVHPTYTPRTVPKTPVDENMTPQRSILRGLNSVSKKRRVAFIPDDEKHDSDSSSSELMEVEPDDIERYKKGSATPVHIRPSPRTPLTVCNNAKKMSMKTPPLHRVPRDPPVKPKQSSLKGFLENEKEQFQTLFPNKEGQQNNKNLKSIHATPTTRTPSNKPPRSKFFSVSPKLRKEGHHKSDKVEDMAWFDLDSVFGFGPED
ncbi:uncharacterized protein LOC126811756 [Patella vulgata]|uniref:uncharacterized protein LOC126811756 n=1 Tax=Patella vulgata TaxID=6465 RepID=UPI0021807BD6|nr:uncharacterized protein LOC126811756 [Patella vulgata]